MNDIDLSKWRLYTRLNTNSWWYIPKRAKHSQHKGDYHGNFVPQIPEQLIERYSKRGDLVLDTFCGSGTSLIECKIQGREGIGWDINADAIDLAQSRIDATDGPGSGVVQSQDCLCFGAVGKSRREVEKLYKGKVQLSFMHPPYHDIIEYNPGVKECLSQCSMDDFLAKMDRLADIISVLTKPKGYAILVIGDKYEKGEWVTLGFDCAEVFKKYFKLKAVVVKNMAGNERFRGSKANLWRYRHLRNGSFEFGHEYVFIFRKGS